MPISRGVRAALALVLVGSAVVASAPEMGEMSMCSTMSFGSISMTCYDSEGRRDTELEAAIRARALSPAQARAAGCEPISWDGESPEPEVTAEPLVTDEPTPTFSPRALDPAVTARVDRAWDGIERWLGAHASATLRRLRNPAQPQDIARWEHYQQTRLPDDLYASLLRHDGADGNFGAGFQLPFSHGLASLDSFTSLRAYNCRDLVMEGPPEAADPESGAWHGSLLPFAATGYGQELFVDPRTGRVGEKEYGRNLRYDGPMGWPSYLALLEALASSLESGTALRERYPSVTAGCELRWNEEPADALPGGCAGAPRPSPTPSPSPTPVSQELTPAQARASGCRPARRRPAVRPVDPAVAARVNAAWRRIERWLAARAPVSNRTLYGPATPVQIARAEAAMGMRFPDDLRASLLRHNGARYWGGFGPAPFYEFMSVKALRADWKMLCGIVLGGPEEMAGFWWDGHLLPFATAIDGGNLFIDTRTGKTGEYFNETGLRFDGDVVWPSYLALLRATADSLETGRPIRGWRPVVRKGELDWKQAR
ncbi:SMI1/KNR4 family protein [Streptosporangium sandarakinum]|uniref:SMI1/KNR4 family protein n=1 Tax=Streptosporangium sandarakinum TaxID=1260955 RepID=UPI003D901160